MGRLERSKKKGTNRKEIVFDENARKEYIQGFRKRKNERRQVARQRIAEEVRQERLKEKAEARAMLKSNREIGLGDHASEDDDSGDEGGGEDGDVPPNSQLASYVFQDTITTTVVTPLLSEEEELASKGQTAVEPGDRPSASAAASRSGENGTKKKKKFDLNIPLASAIPGYKPPVTKKAGGKGKKKKSKKGKLISKKEKARNRGLARSGRE